MLVRLLKLKHILKHPVYISRSINPQHPHFCPPKIDDDTFYQTERFLQSAELLSRMIVSARFLENHHGFLREMYSVITSAFKGCIL